MKHPKYPKLQGKDPERILAENLGYCNDTGEVHQPDHFHPSNHQGILSKIKHFFNFILGKQFCHVCGHKVHETELEAATMVEMIQYIKDN